MGLSVCVRDHGAVRRRALPRAAARRCAPPAVPSVASQGRRREGHVKELPQGMRGLRSLPSHRAAWYVAPADLAHIQGQVPSGSAPGRGTGKDGQANKVRVGR